MIPVNKMLRKASFKIGLKSFLYLFLAFAFNGKVSNATFTELGCEFENNDYKTERNRFSMEPKWTELVLSNMDLPLDPKDSYWQPIRDYLSEVSVVNDVSPLKKFVEAYKTKKSNECLESFFDNYDFPFQLNETRDPASYIIQMFHKLKDNNQNKPEKPVLEYYYIVSATVDPGEKDISLVQTNNDFEDYMKRAGLVQRKLKTRVQDHFAGIIKTNNGDRTGYILIDPGYAGYPPFVVFLMEDEEYPHQEFLDGFSRNGQIQFSVKPSEPFILANHTYSNTETKVLYYTGKPYCSFIENTMKMNLLRLNYEFIERDSKNKKEFYLRLKISPNNKPLISLEKMNNSTTAKMNIKVEKKNNMSILNSNNPKDVNQPITFPTILKGLSGSIKVTTITEELEYILANVNDDQKFFSNFTALSKKLGLNKALPQYNREEPKEQTRKLASTNSLSFKRQTSLLKRNQRITGGMK